MKRMSSGIYEVKPSPFRIVIHRVSWWRSNWRNLKLNQVAGLKQFNIQFFFFGFGWHNTDYQFRLFNYEISFSRVP